MIDIDTKEVDVAYDYHPEARLVRIEYDPRGWGNSKNWEYPVRNFEEAQLAYASLVQQLNGVNAPAEIQIQILSQIDSLKFNNMSHCRVVHLPVRPIESNKFEQFLGLVDQLTSRTLANVQDQIHSTQKMFNYIAQNGDEYEVLIALDLNYKIQAVSITRDGESLQNQYIEMNEDGVRINDESGEEVFSYEFQLDVDNKTGFDELWLTLYTKQNEIGISEKENFRIHTENGRDFQAYRYHTLVDLFSESIVDHSQQKRAHSMTRKLTEELNDELNLSLVFVEEIPGCINQKTCSLSILANQVFEKTIGFASIDIESKGRLRQSYQACLEQKEILKTTEISSYIEDSNSIAEDLKFCAYRLNFLVDKINFKLFMTSRFLSLPEDSKLLGFFKICESVNDLIQLKQCREAIDQMQIAFANTQPTFHLEFLNDIESCVASIQAFDVFLNEIGRCIDNQNIKFQKVLEIEEIVNGIDSFPELIKGFISTQEVSTYLNSCQSKDCFKDFIAEKYASEIIPDLLNDYPIDDSLKQILNNRMLRLLRRIHREDLSTEEYSVALKGFERDVLSEIMSKSFDGLAEELLQQRYPEYYSADAEGKLVRASETFDYQGEREQIVSEFLSHMHIDQIGSNDQSLDNQISLAIEERGIRGGQIVLNQTVKDFYLWSSDKRSEELLSQNSLYIGNELGYRMEDISEEVEECFENYSPTSRELSVQNQIVRCEIKRIKAVSYYKGKKLIEKEISKYFDLQSIKANELMGINQFLRRCLRNKEKESQTIEAYELASMQCLSLAYIDTKQNIYKYQAIDENFTKLAGNNSPIYAESLACLKRAFNENRGIEETDNAVTDSLDRIMDYSFSAPTRIRYMSSIYSDVAYESVENHEVYRGHLNSYLSQLNKEELSNFVKELDEGCFASFEDGRIRAVREGIVRLAGLDSLNLTTNLNESAKEVFADAIDLELVEMLLSDDFLLDEEYFSLTMAGASADVQYVNKKMTIDFLVNTVNGISNLLKEGFYNDPDEAKTALVTFSSRLKELIQIAEANNRPFHMHDLLGILRQHRLFDTLAIGYLSKHMRTTISGGLLEFRDEQIRQNNIRHPSLKELVEGDIRSENITMRSAVYRKLRSDRTFRLAGIYSSSSDYEGRAIANLIKEKIILPQLLGGEPTVSTIDELNQKIVNFFDDRNKSVLFFGDAAREYRNNSYAFIREKQWSGTGTNIWLRQHGNRDDFVSNYNSSTKRTQYIQHVTDRIFLEPFRRNNSHFRDITSDSWYEDGRTIYDLISEIAD